jgi:asparagine synthase (glutamine-hydrolysing)
MCGIAGALGYIDDATAQAVQRMDRAQVHRGPDAHGFWRNTSQPDPHAVALAHRRLSILDLTDAGAQPMVDPETGFVIIYNGEVYNFADIRRDLESLGHRFKSHCDTEVILQAVARWGIACVDRFRGMFTFAIWDPHKKQLHLARDRVGIKPLYLMPITSPQGSTLFFASELRALLATGLAQKQLDPAGLSSYLWHGFVSGPNTLVRGIELLPAGTYMTIDAGQPLPAPTRFWQIPSATTRPNAVEQLREQLEQAVKLRLIADVPLGVFLSGGIDSSAVAALAAKAAPGAIHTFNIGFDDPAYDESRYAQAVADSLHTQHTCIHLTESAFKAQLPDALQCIDQPTFDAINTYFVSRAVREAGVTVALAGTGGDELFGGYRSFLDIPQAIAWGRRLSILPEPLLRAAASTVSRFKHGPTPHLPAQTRWGKLGDALATRGDLLKTYQVSYSLFTQQFLDQLSPFAFTRNGTSHGLTAPAAAELAELIQHNPTLHAISMLELSSFIGQRLMRDTDAASMAVSLEVRVPLLDHQVIQAASAVDQHRRFMPLRGKQLLRDLALKDLDPNIFNRPKSGFVLPIDTWCRQSLNQQITDTFHDTKLCQSVGLDPHAVALLWQSFNDDAPGLYWSRLWSLFVLLWWCRRYGISI